MRVIFKFLHFSPFWILYHQWEVIIQKCRKGNVQVSWLVWLALKSIFKIDLVSWVCQTLINQIMIKVFSFFSLNTFWKQFWIYTKILLVCIVHIVCLCDSCMMNPFHLHVAYLSKYAPKAWFCLYIKMIMIILPFGPTIGFHGNLAQKISPLCIIFNFFKI